ncbi:HD superfamily phosphohydrolase [Methanolinea mesophila]|uniref:HD domain-containing protein n=1 Tax=Methanolinea mesophila TaxID=547055 RepID=UPI001AE4C28B|nr:HD domain-containing protein [Methanolinea mesophila]MBP1928745.1 HD superfamily phosphohydrolase [Methanolinea mesophila]
MKIIKDPVHGYIDVADFVLPLLDSPLLQRLRYVKQLGFSFLVYPGANHTRFEHSLGTMYLSDLMARQLQLDEEEQKLVAAAALLHDIGHGPFSHAIEPLMEDLLGYPHHYIRPLLEDPYTRDALEGQGISPADLVSLIDGDHPLSGIIHGELDVDRMDYLLRDAHYTGAPYGTVDAHRLIRSTLRAKDQIVLHESGINAAESLLIARTLMRPAVYYHHVSRIAEMMFLLSVTAHLSGNRGEAFALMRMDDAKCMHTLLTSPVTVARELAEGLYARRLYKRALYVGQDQVNAYNLAGKASHHDERVFAVEIADRAGVPPHLVLVDIPEFPSDMSLPIQVKNRHRVLGLGEVSPILTTLNETRKGQWRVGVYTLPAHVEAVGRAAAEVLHVRPVTTQKRLITEG